MARVDELNSFAGPFTAADQIYVQRPAEGTLDWRTPFSDLVKALQTGFGAAVDVGFTIGAEAADVRDIAVQLKDAYGTNIAEAQLVHVLVLADAAAAALATTGGSTGIAVDTNGILLATDLAKKAFRFLTNGSGLLDLKWTDTGTEAVYLGVVLSNGRMKISAVVQNA